MIKKILYCISFASLFVISACGGGSGGGQSTTSNESGGYSGAQNGQGVMKPNAYLFSASASDGSTLVGNLFTVKKPQSKIHDVGDVLVLDNHGGHLLKVLSVQSSDTHIVYTIDRASLTDVFSELKVAFNGELTPQDLGQTFASNDPEVEIAWAKSLNSRAPLSQNSPRAAISASTNTLQIKYKKVGAQLGSGIEIDGSSDFVLNPDFSLNLQTLPGQTLPSLEMNAVISPTLRTSISVSSLYGGQVSYMLDKSFPLPAFKRIIIVPILGVPVPVPFWIKPTITLSGSVNGTAGSKFITTKNYGVDGSVGFRLPAGMPPQGLGNMVTSSDLNVSDVQSEFGVNITAPKVEIHFAIYSFAGPNFDIGLESGVSGKNSVEGNPPTEGVKVQANSKLVANGGLKAALDFKNIDAVKKLFGDVSAEYSAFSLKLYEHTFVEKSWFFPFTGTAGVVVRDNGAVADDIFEVSLDGVVIGRTNKGGSGQFRLKNLRPGARTLTIKTVEDDAPPGTYEVMLNDGLLFEGGGNLRSGGLNLDSSISFQITVPQP
jgi:hypothetical protein